jgi:hypothetical protein
MQHRQNFLHTREIGGGDHHGVLRRVDLGEFSGGDRAAHEAHPMGGGQIGGEAASPGDQCRVFQPADGAADPGCAGAFGMRGHRQHRSSPRKRGPRAANRVARLRGAGFPLARE